MLLDQLPPELLWCVFHGLTYDDLDTLLHFDFLAPLVRHYLHRHYRFHYKIASLLRLFESLTPTERHKDETRKAMATQLLHFITTLVEKRPKYEHRNTFTDLLDTLHHLVLRRVLSPDLRSTLEHDYASLCLEIRHIYLHTSSIRVLHDPKYRRRSTKYPLAPFLPRDFTSVWRSHCARGVEMLNGPGLDAELLAWRETRLRFAQFFGALFEVTSLYLESNLDGTFDECLREALVTGDVESLLVLCVAADRPVDVEAMCTMVTHAGEQLWSYLDTMEDWMTTDPTPQQAAPLEQLEHQTDQLIESPPEWLLQDRYKIHSDAKLRLKVKKFRTTICYHRNSFLI
ncbi:uncharacterized protein BYT42DRAFT_562997 [Radiomyces spectabilis]|uniref:uncharacterized protein n=1 Tax=Radiomyces spectabilis TaxID=64574 RepID=UPI002220D90F|nr:uncharacterized protein BYT42DRAFT_562997 [Radiomyces spectabilis]KAI8384586.1 hypothetical protein BYT42DRAFT_562997 [Radiomyces spectabilis]